MIRVRSRRRTNGLNWFPAAGKRGFTAASTACIGRGSASARESFGLRRPLIWESPAWRGDGVHSIMLRRVVLREFHELAQLARRASGQGSCIGRR